MLPDAFYGLAHLVVAAAYLAIAPLTWQALHRPGAAAGAPPLARWLMPFAVLGHALLLAHEMFAEGGLRFGFAHALSATFLTTALLLWVEGFFVSLGGLYVLVTPVAALASVLPALFHGAPLAAEQSAPALRVHLTAAMLAYTFFTIAALHALLMSSIDRFLHRPQRDASGLTSRLLAQMPSMLALESLLFRQIAVGFVLLTATVISGSIFSRELFGRPLRFDHMTVFAIASWIVFAGLLAGRHFFGWRGRVALRWTLVGFVMLLLAYVGSRFVYEVLLRRIWI
jgi:ABC-type uncharacterized transport system permease subunit